MIVIGIKKYKDLKVGETFRIVRDRPGGIYVKKEYWFEDVTNSKLAFRPLWGGTHCEVVKL